MISDWHSTTVQVSGLKEESRIYDIRTFQSLKMRAVQFSRYVGIQLSIDQRRILEKRKPQLHRCKTRKGLNSFCGKAGRQGDRRADMQMLRREFAAISSQSDTPAKNCPSV